MNEVLQIEPLFGNTNLGRLKSVLKELSHGRRFSKLLWGMISLDHLDKISKKQTASNRTLIRKP